MLVEACLWAVIAGSGVSPQSAPMHGAEIRNCLGTVETYVRAHCPAGLHDSNVMWGKVQAVSTSKAHTDAKALTAACPS